MTGFYVTIIKSRTSGQMFKPGQVSYAAGPFADHDEAESWVGPVREHVLLNYADAHWWAYGTTRVKSKNGKALPEGKLNAVLSISSSNP